MPPAAFTFTAVVEVQDGPAPGSFVALPAALARELRLQVPGGVTGRGWGSLRVQATIGGTTWATSIFPSKQRGSYLLPSRRRCGPPRACAPARRRASGCGWTPRRPRRKPS